MRILEKLKSIFTKINLNFLIFNFKSFSVKTKIFLVFSFVILLLLVAVNLIIINYQKKSIQNQFYSNLRLNLENLSMDITDEIIHLDILKLDDKLTPLKENLGLDYIMVVDLTGRIIAHTEPINLGKKISVNFETFKRWELLDSQKIRHFNFPVFTEDYPLGAVRAGIKEDFVEALAGEAIEKLRNYLLILSGIFLILTLAVSYFLSGILLKPLEKLKESIRNFQTYQAFTLCENENLALCKDYYKCSNLDCPAHGKTRCWLISEAKQRCKETLNLNCETCQVYKTSCGDEIGYLVEAFNEMIIKLENYMKELDETIKEKIKLEKTSAVAEMAMVLAHEIKNPLNAIKAASSYLKENFKGKVLQEFLSIIEGEVNRLNELVTGFLSYARPLPLKFEKINLNSLIKELVNLVKPEIEEDKKNLKVILDEEIPETYLDPYQFKQALLNLIVNAEDATKEGDEIILTTKKEEEHIAISIKDTGEGIPEEYLEKIFDPFFTTKATGFGLGLACVERIVREHGGKIEVRSSPQNGTEFIIKLPIRKEL